MNGRCGASLALYIMLLSVPTAAAIAETGRVTSAACAWSGTWASSDGSMTQTIQLTGQSLKGTYSLLDEECPYTITGSTKLILNSDGMTARGTYHENDNSCWGASSGAIAFELNPDANRLNFRIRTEEGKELSDFMLRKQLARLPDCETTKQVARANARPEPSNNRTAQPKAVNENYNVRKASQYMPYKILDQERNMIAAVIKMPADWRAHSNVVWNYQDTGLPVRVEARAESQTGEAWIEGYPTELFFWVEPEYQPMSNGVRYRGMIKQTPLSAEEALLQYIVLPARGHYPHFTVIARRQIPNLAEAWGDKPVSGHSVAIRVSYQQNSQPIQEEFYGLLSATQSIPTHGSAGTLLEHHTLLQYVHSIGAKDNKLDSMKALLGGIASSFTVNPSWQKAVAQVNQYLIQEFNAELAQTYAGIQAAGQLSRQISAQNDAWFADFERRRIASDRQMEQFMADMQAEGDAYDKSNENFSQYMRGTEKMQDPYWGESDQSYDYQYHWTDGYGSYQHSNDLGDDPNIGSTQNWTLMQPVS